jgi:protein SCO1/2
MAGRRSPLTMVRLYQALLAAAIMLCCACHSNPGAYDAFNKADCLPAITLVDQGGHEVQLSSFKGKPVVVSFIYTSCPGPCLLLTQKMARVAARLAPRIGSDFTMLSITVDPEHDGSLQLAGYVKDHGIDPKGWSFLTGSPADVDRLLADFQLRRQRDRDGSVEHITGIFLLGPDGHELREYDGEVVKAATVINDLQEVLSRGPGALSSAAKESHL